MTSTQFHSAEEKEKVLRKLQKFFEKGCPKSGFTKIMYEYVNSMFGHIAHYDIHGYYEEWFSSPERIAQWLDRALSTTVVGNPEFCFSDVEREIQVWIRESGIRDRFNKQVNDRLVKAELAELKRLQGKYANWHDLR